MNRLRATISHDLLQVLGYPFLMLEGLFRAGRLVLERDADALMKVADDLKAFPYQIRIEFDLREDGRVGMKRDRRARTARCARLLERTGRFAPFERHLP